MTHDEMIEVIQSHKDGKVIQFKRNCGVCDWTSLAKVKSPHWNFSAVKYRVKPEPKEYWLVPYTNKLGYLVFEDPASDGISLGFSGLDLDFSRVKHVVTVEELNND
jgi:hypothetical protein